MSRLGSFIANLVFIVAWVWFLTQLEGFSEAVQGTVVGLAGMGTWKLIELWRARRARKALEIKPDFGGFGGF